MKKILYVVLLLLVLAGCADNGDSEFGFSPYVGGTRGLTMQFVENSPPSQIFDGGTYPFAVSVVLENVGEAAIAEGAGFLRIHGINPSEFGITSADMRQPIPAMRPVRKSTDRSVLDGEIAFVTFSELNYQKNEPGTFAIDNFRVSACYDYMTRSSSQICIKQDNVDGLRDNEICRVNEPKTSVNSGAPIQIQNLRQTSMGQSGIQISFDVVHVGNPRNRWFLEGDAECNDIITNQDLFKVEVEVEPIIDGRYTARCSGGSFNGGNVGEVRLFNGEPRKIVCSFDIGNQDSDFETRANINVRYRYLEYIEQRLVINSMGGE
ncbi:MAG: lipoprotein [Candidatus Woesearchaeota archaeon]